MFSILNRIAWIVAIIGWWVIMSVGLEYIIPWIMCTFIVKIFLWENFIKTNIVNYNKRLERSILEQLGWVSHKPESPVQNPPSVDQLNQIENSPTFSHQPLLEETQPDMEPEKKTSTFTANTIKNEVKQEPSKIAVYLKEFFAENIMAKIGWILLALWVIFLMSLVYTKVWEVAKVMIWFALWFSTYGIWAILHKKWYKAEWFILLWAGILINYIVILWGRFIIWDYTNGFLSSGTTFIFLILNTLFSITTSYLYSSNNLLLFSIFFAFIIPFLIGFEEKTPYLHVWYGLIVSLWWYIISNYFHKNWNQTNSIILFFISLIGWNILLFSSPFWDNSTYFVIKLFAYNILNFVWIFLMYKNRLQEYILHTFIISFAFLAMIMFSGYALESIWILISFIIWVLGLLIFTSLFIITWTWSWLIYILFLPMIFVLGFMFIWWAGSWVILLPIFLLAYLWVFAFGFQAVVSQLVKYIFFGVIWIFLTIWSFHLKMNIDINLPIIITLGATWFIFLLSSYFLSSKKDLTYLYSIGTLASIFILLPLIDIVWEFYKISIVLITLFWIINYITPFINKNLIENDTKNIILWNVFWILFIWGNLFRFWTEYFPWIALWYSFLGLAILYCIGWFILFNKLQKDTPTQGWISQKEEKSINVMYMFLAISLSLFSIAVALIFSNLPIIIALIWLIESSVVLFFTKKYKPQKILIAGIILCIIWLIKLFQVISLGELWYNDLIASLLIIGSLFLNIIFIRDVVCEEKVVVKILHVVWMISIHQSLLQIFDFDRNGGGFIFTIIFIGILWILYNFLKESLLKSSYIGLLTLFFLVHISGVNSIENYFNNYIVTLIAGLILSIELISFKDDKSKFVAWSVWIYILIITSIYLYHHTQDYLSLTIYWWILSLVWVHVWIWTQIKVMRFVWLVLLIITLLKISFYDVWSTIDDPMIRVIAFMVVWGIMIYISMLYKKHNLNIKDDFYIEQINHTPQSYPDENSQNIINKKIENIDVSNITNITFSLTSGEVFAIKSKNLFKIALLVIHNKNKTHFDPRELQEIYEYVLANYTSNLSKQDYEKVTTLVKKFVDEWGSLEIIKK